MLILTTYGEQIQCDRAVKGPNYLKVFQGGQVISADSNISDFSGYILTDENGNPVPFEIDGIPTDLEQYRTYRIKESKQGLADYLEAHPMPSSVHGGKEALYNVTEEKRGLLISEMMMGQLAAMAGIPRTPSWNATGQPCEPWTAEELAQLSFEMDAYVKPLVAYQQHLEVTLKACETVEEIQAVEIDYSKVGEG